MLPESEMLHTITCIYITLFFAPFLPIIIIIIIIINQSILATHINSEVEKLDVLPPAQISWFFFILPSLFTALELQSGSNRPQANAASGNAVITFFTLFFFHAKHKCKVLSSARRYGNNGNGTKHWAEMFWLLFTFSLYHSKQDDFEFWWISFFFPFYSNSILDFYELHTGGYTHFTQGDTALWRVTQGEKLWKKTKSTPFFEKDPKQN